MNTNDTSFSLLQTFIKDGKDSYGQLRCYIKNCGKYILKPGNLSVCDSSIYLKDNELFYYGTFNEISKDMAIYSLKDIF